mgnify:FL=1
MLRSHFKLNLFFLIKILFLFLSFLLSSYAGELNTQKNLVSIGKDDAPVEIKIYSSLTCPHCADFHTNVLPKIKSKYVETGKVKLILIDFPLDELAFNASKLLHCVDTKDQISYLDTIYETQSEWTSGTSISEINDNLRNIVQNFGVNQEKFDKCLNNQKVEDRILEGRIYGQKRYSIESTPTIVINDKKLNTEASFKNIEKKIEKLI